MKLFFFLKDTGLIDDDSVQWQKNRRLDLKCFLCSKMRKINNNYNKILILKLECRKVLSNQKN